MKPPAQFIFATCQLGAERVLKQEFLRECPEWKPAFSRPGFVTFKAPPGDEGAAALDLRLVFARAWGHCLGKTTAESASGRAEEAWRLVEAAEILDEIRALHVWPRRLRPEAEESPSVSLSADPLVAEADRLLRQTCPETCPASARLAQSSHSPEQHSGPARADDIALDCILVEPNEWWLGWHRATTPNARWPGGLFPVSEPANMVSRAYLKMDEALAWSRLPVEKGDVCAELGAAPGGASQALLARGLTVCGVDPADMAPAVLAHPDFHHWKMRGADIRRRYFVPVRWLMADMNVAPNYTLDCVESIVTHRAVHVRGMLLTLKLADWDLADRVPDWIERVRSWGFRDVRARQLLHNRQEICIAALRRTALRRLSARKRAHRGAKRIRQRSKQRFET